MTTVSHAARIELQGMLPHAAHLRNAGEDWTGITDQKARKKLQNRLNKRISRTRQRTQYTRPASGIYVTTSSAPTPTYHRSSVCCPLPNLHVSFAECSAETISHKRAVLHRFAAHALQSYATADPCADHALRLIQLNIINGLTRNAAALGFEFDWLVCEVVSPFGRDAALSTARLSLNSTPGCSTTCTSSTTPQTAAAAAAPVPTSLAPTTMQLHTRHHPWLDLFPLPALRNNLLTASRLLSLEDEQALYSDVLESGGGRREWAGLVVWGDPWDARNWEVSEPFLRRWGWVLDGCAEIMLEATNRWRAERGEAPIGISAGAEIMKEAGAFGV